MSSVSNVIREAAEPLTGSASDYNSLLDLVGEARFVLLGEASHGTHEFYWERAEISKRLVLERGFCAVAVEADWTTRIRSTPLSEGRVVTPTAWKRWTASSAFRNGCGEMPTFSISWVGSVSTMMVSHRITRSAAFTGWISTACTHRSRLFSVT